MFSLKDKVIVVTGGEGLLGAAFVSWCEKAGALCISADIESRGKSSHFEAFDVTDFDAVPDFVRKLVNKYGRLDGWVNNAYPRTTDWGTTFSEVNFDSWRENVDVQMNSYARCCQVVLNYMKEQGNGSLINIGSIYGMGGPDFTIYDGTELTTPGAYTAIKGGITNLSRFLAAYYGPHKLRVNTVSPGGVFNNQPKSFVENYEKRTPLKRMANPDDIAAAIVFLLSDEAGYVTGQNIAVDGGWTAI